MNLEKTDYLKDFKILIEDTVFYYFTKISTKLPQYTHTYFSIQMANRTIFHNIITNIELMMLISDRKKRQKTNIKETNSKIFLINI